MKARRYLLVLKVLFTHKTTEGDKKMMSHECHENTQKPSNLKNIVKFSKIKDSGSEFLKARFKPVSLVLF